MKQKNNYDYPLLTVLGLIFFLIHIVQYTDCFNVKNAGAFPQLMLPVAVFSGMFFDDKIGAIFGFIAGGFVDSVSTNTICYNSIMLMLIGYFTGVFIEHLVNNNFRASLILIFFTSVIYYLGLWCVCGFDQYYISVLYIKLLYLTLAFSIPIYWGIFYIIKLRKKSLVKKQQ